MFKFLKRSPKNIFPDAKHTIEFCFRVGGKDYYKFTDLLNTPYERALSALVYYREADMNIDRDFLEKHLEAINEVLLSPRIDIFKIKGLNDQLMQRLKLPKSSDLLWKLASVVYFDKDESPVTYDWEYSKRKIEFWKEHSSVNDFFLQQPVIDLIPYLRHCGENLSEFGKMMEDIDRQHSDNLSTLSSPRPKTT